MNNHNSESRLHALDAVRGFALLLGVAFHAALSFMPGMAARRLGHEQTTRPASS